MLTSQNQAKAGPSSALSHSASHSYCWTGEGVNRSRSSTRAFPCLFQEPKEESAYKWHRNVGKPLRRGANITAGDTQVLYKTHLAVPARALLRVQQQPLDVVLKGRVSPCPRPREAENKTGKPRAPGGPPELPRPRHKALFVPDDAPARDAASAQSPARDGDLTR